MELITIIVNDFRSQQSAVITVDRDLSVARVAGAAAALFGYDYVASIGLQNQDTDIVLRKGCSLAEECVGEGDCLVTNDIGGSV